MRKLRSLEDLEIDDGVFVAPAVPAEVDEEDREKKNEAQRIQVAPNQSSSWPLSRMICRQPVQMMRAAKP